MFSCKYFMVLTTVLLHCPLLTLPPPCWSPLSSPKLPFLRNIHADQTPLWVHPKFSVSFIDGHLRYCEQGYSGHGLAVICGKLM